MKLFSGLFLFIIPSVLLSSEFGMTVNGKNDLILSGENCQELLKEQSALCQWKKNIDPDFKIPNFNKCEALKDGAFKVTVSDCLPDLAKKYQHKKLYHEGPNCWGTAMSFKELSPTPRFMWPEEMHFWMESPICRKLLPNEPLLPGDILNIYGPEKLDAAEKIAKDAGTEYWDYLFPNRSTQVTQDLGIGFTGFHRLLHSVTYISKHIAFGKDSPSELDEFYFHPLEEVYGRPRADESDCQENQTLIPHLREYQNTPKRIHGRKCSYLSLAYRCESLKSYFSKQALSEVDSTIWKNILEMQEIQKKLFPIVVSSNMLLKQNEINQFNYIASSAIERSSKEMQVQDLLPLKKQLLTLQYFTAAGIRKSLEQAHLQP
jgi:hypothetical protein